MTHRFLANYYGGLASSDFFKDSNELFIRQYNGVKNECIAADFYTNRFHFSKIGRPIEEPVAQWRVTRSKQKAKDKLVAFRKAAIELMEAWIEAEMQGHDAVGNLYPFCTDFQSIVKDIDHWTTANV